MTQYLNVYGQAHQKCSKLAKNIMFCPKMAIFLVQKNFPLAQKFCLIECVILSHHMSLYLNVYGQAHQKSEMAPAAALPPYAFLKSSAWTNESGASTESGHVLPSVH